MSLKTWNNGDTGENVKAIIEANFKILGKYLSSNILCLSTEERNLLGSDYTSNGLIVYDKTERDWYENSNGIWVLLPKDSVTCEIEFSVSSWEEKNGNYQISIVYDTHKVNKPSVQVYDAYNGIYTVVSTNIIRDEHYNITICSDIAFNGKVVIK